MDELRKKTLVGSFWMAIDRFGYLSVQFVSNLVLARLLMPEDFGTIGVMMVFITLANVFIDCGFSASLIQKQEVTEKDKSTVFILNLFLSVIIYGILFFISPWIANFFHNAVLGLLLRVLGIVLLIDAFCAIQNTIFIREMNFKLIAKIKLVAIFIAAVVAIIFAFQGWGVWALLLQYIFYSVIRTSGTWLASKWYPKMSFSMESFKSLFGFGSKLLLSTLVAELYVNFQQILIGRFYKPVDLGYYSQARQFQQIPTGTISQVINSVAFPAYAKLQNDRMSLRELFRQNVRIVAYFNTATMFLLALIAQPLIILLYSDKWIGSVEYFQFLCIGFGVFLAVHQCSLSVLKAVGRSNYVLTLEIIKKVFGVIFIIIGLNFWGIWGILYALALNSFIEIFLNGYYLKKEIQYGGINQLLDILPPVVIATLSAIASYYSWSLVYHQGNEFITILFLSIVFSMYFFFGSWIARLYGFEILIKGLIKVVNRLKSK